MRALRAPGPLARRLLLRVLGFSLCFTLLAGALQLYLEYRREMRDIETRLELIRSGYLASFERSLWDLNQAQLNVQLHGLVDFPDIAWASLASADFNLIQGDIQAPGPLRVEHFPLSYQPPDGECRALGELTVRWTGPEEGDIEVTDEFDEPPPGEDDAPADPAPPSTEETPDE